MTLKRNVNIIELKDGIIRFTQIGDQNQGTANHTIGAIKLLAEGLKEIKILADYRNSGKMDKNALQGGYFALKDIDIDKAAVVGASPYLIRQVNAMSSAAGKNEIIYFAKSVEEALEWLKN
jgi:hypothetical protein